MRISDWSSDVCSSDLVRRACRDVFAVTLLPIGAVWAQPDAPTVPGPDPRDARQLAAVVVTATREARPLSETPISVGLIDAMEIQQNKPTHPAQIVSQVPSVAVAVTNGEGRSAEHTSELQPLMRKP